MVNITKTFVGLWCPKGLLAELREAAKGIHGRNKTQSECNRKKYLVVPGSGLAQALGKALRGTGFSIVCAAGSKISGLVQEKKGTTNECSVVYSIPCKGCDLSYYGETARGLSTRLKEHRADVRHHRQSSA